MSEYIIFDDVDSRNYSIVIYSKKIDNSPKREYNKISVPGRNGDLLIDSGKFSNVQHIYSGIIYSNFESNLKDFRDAICSKINYKHLSDSIHSDEFYEAAFTDIIDVKTVPGRNMGKFDIIFSRKPQRFLVSGDSFVTLSVSGSQSISNPTNFYAKPIIKVTGQGSFYVGNNLVTIAPEAGSITYIDSDIQDCYYNTSNRNMYVSFSANEFPLLKPGTNNIEVTSGNITGLSIKPRWWTV